MIRIVLYQNKADEKDVDKSKFLTEIADFQGTLKNEVSMYEPSILIERSENSRNVNYFYIPIWKRYYFVTDIVRVRDNIIEVKGRCDVLSSFKNEILNCSGICSRSEKSYNLYLDDGSLRVYNNRRVQYKYFPSGFNAQEIVLAVAG